MIFGTDEAPPGWGVSVHYSPQYDENGLPQAPGLSGPAAPFLPDRVIGTQRTGWAPNGDFAISRAEVLRGDLSALRRVAPGWAAPR